MSANTFLIIVGVVFGVVFVGIALDIIRYAVFITYYTSKGLLYAFIIIGILWAYFKLRGKK